MAKIPHKGDGWFTAAEAEHKDAPFLCGCCGEPVILKKGHKRVHHFAHTVDSTCGLAATGTAQESMQHKYAKHILRSGFSDWTFECGCITCDTQQLVSWPDKKVYSAAEEWAWAGGEFVLDVAILKGGTAIAALEVYHTHTIKKEKRGKLERSGLVVVEVEAATVIKAYERACYRAKDVCNTNTMGQCAECSKIQHNVAKRILATVIQEFKEHAAFQVTCPLGHDLYVWHTKEATSVRVPVEYGGAVCVFAEDAIRAMIHVTAALPTAKKAFSLGGAEIFWASTESVLQTLPQSGKIVFRVVKIDDSSCCKICIEQRELAAMQKERQAMEMAGLFKEDPMFAVCERGVECISHFPRQCVHLVHAFVARAFLCVQCPPASLCLCVERFRRERMEEEIRVRAEESLRRNAAVADALLLYGECIDGALGEGCRKSARKPCSRECFCVRQETWVREAREYDALMLQTASDLEVVFLDVPFEARELAKSLGAQWNKVLRKWFVDADVAAAEVRLQDFWTPQFRVLQPYLMKLRAERACKRAKLDAIDATVGYPLTFASDFFRMLELQPESTCETAADPKNAYLRVSPADLRIYVHKRCDRPQWTVAECRVLQEKMKAHRRAINGHYGLEHDDETTIGLEIAPQPYFWGVKLRDGVLEDKPSAIGIRVLF